MRPVSSWGRLSNYPHDVISLNDPARVGELIDGGSHPGIAYGMGRSYGDVCLNPGGTLWATRGLNHFIAFDRASGQLRCEAGVLLRDIQRMAVPRGWMLPVTPGTEWVTVGGAIANDVHGKNHHVRGSFGDHVQALTLVRTDGEIIRCGPNERPAWYAATVGGLGLTGVISEAAIQLLPIAGPWLTVETLPFDGLTAFFQLADASEAGWEYTVSWIDCTSKSAARGLFMRANPQVAPGRAEPEARVFAMPMVPPVSLMNRLSLRPFNWSYYHLKKHQAGRSMAHYLPFFYPLDRVAHWNRIYGPRGFFQYQSVVPPENGQDAVQAMLNEIARSGLGSFLAVLKTFGDRTAPGLLSFPRPGTTLALDFANSGKPLDKLFERLDAIVREAKGRIYPAKDARMPRALFEMGFPRLHEFMAYRDPGIGSALSRRLMGT